MSKSKALNRLFTNMEVKVSKAVKWLFSFLVFIIACLFSTVLAFGNYYYYQWINGFLHIKDAFLSALVFSAFLIVIGFVIVIRRPRFYGFQIGESIKKWKLNILIAAAVCLFTAICLSMVPRTPYSGANWAVEMILVPVSEEMMWRGVLFALIYKSLDQIFGEKANIALSVIISSIAFGLAHVSNVLVHPFSFVLMQMVFAAIAGSGMGYLRAKTKSVYPAMIVHALFNLIAILF